MPDDLMSASGAVTPPPATTAPDASPRERWRPIPGHKGYEASSGGRVRSVTRVLRDGRHAGGMVLAAQRDKDGYATVKIRGKRLRVARVVQLAFAGPPEVRHLDGDKSNDRPENLAWGSRVENEQDKRKGKEEKEEDTWERPPLPSLSARTARTGLISLSEAVSLRVVSGSLAAVRKASQREPLFPAHAGFRGAARLYDPAELVKWEQWRR